jgi:hypothetical protein
VDAHSAHPPPRRDSIVIRDAPRGSSSAPIKREAAVKKEVHSLPHGHLHLRDHRAPLLPPILPALPPEKKWWEVEMQAEYRDAEEPEDAPGHHLLVHRLIDEDVSVAMQRHALWWSDFDNKNVVDPHDPSSAPTPATTVNIEDAKESSDFDFGYSSEGDDGEGAESLDFNAFDHHHYIRIYFFTLY